MLINMVLPGAVEVVPPDENTLLLLHGEDLTDSSIYKSIITNNNVTVSTAQSKFGGSSLYFNGSNAKLEIPFSDMFDFGTGDFTIDLWMYPQTTSTEQSIFSSVATGGFFFSIRDASRIGIGRVSEAWDTTINASLTANAWNHVAVVRSNSTVMLFINGVLKGSGTNATSYSMGGDSIQIGAEINACYYNGYIDEFRVSNVARWTENFTPPTEPYDPNGSNGGNGGTIENFLFTYSGNYTDNRDADGKGKVRLNTSGTLVTTGQTVKVSVYILAGGGGGYLAVYYPDSRSGGGGGNQTVEVELAPGTYEIVIGTGGTGTTTMSAQAGNGGNTVAFGYTSTGGTGAKYEIDSAPGGTPNGGNGGRGLTSGGFPNGGNSTTNATDNNGGDGYVELTFI